MYFPAYARKYMFSMITVSQSQREIKRFLDSNTGPAIATKVVLAALVLSGVVFTVATAPAVFAIVRQYKRGKRMSQKQVEDALGNLKRSSFIKEERQLGGKKKVSVTHKGEKYAHTIVIDAVKLPAIKDKKWDGIWRVVLFDIPIRFTKGREGLRFKLKEFGFYQMQKSVWVYPYACEREVLLVADFYGVRKYVEIMHVNAVLHEDKLKRHFRISL